MARLEDGGWSFIQVSGSAMVLAVGDWLFITCSWTTRIGFFDKQKAAVLSHKMGIL